jgi:hypothetical protein
MNKLDEPIALSAPLARRLAPRLCRKDPVSGEDCSWYHGLWQDLRAIGLAASPEHQADFFLSAFKRLAVRRRRLRLLISGAADYSILAHVLWACNEHGLEADVTVADRCETPLFLNNWYAQRAGQTIRAVREDIFEYRPEAPFDVICSHSFLGQFPPQRRTTLVEKWSQLLAPMGSVLAVNRVRPDGTPRNHRFSPDQARSFCATVERRIRESPSLPESEASEIFNRARIYVQRLHGYAISAAELAALFQQAGFRIDDLVSVVSSDSRNSDASGPAVPACAEHACLLATKSASQR